MTQLLLIAVGCKILGLAPEDVRGMETAQQRCIAVAVQRALDEPNPPFGDEAVADWCRRELQDA
jgi:hypothetical protein